MNRLLGLLVAIVAFVGAVTPASAATLRLSNSTVSISIGTLPPIEIPQDPSSIEVYVSSGGGGFSISQGLFASSVALPSALFTGVPLISGLTVNAANGNETFAPGGGGPEAATKNFGDGHGFGGPGPISGSAFVNVLAFFNLTVPLNVVGVTSGSLKTVTGGLAVTVKATNWTTGAVQVTGVTSDTPNGMVTNTVSFAGFDNRTAGHLGSIQLISPLRIVTSVAGNLGGFAIQTLNFVPEPGTLLLLGSGVAGLALIGRHRKRS